MQNSTAQKLYKKLITQDLEPEALDAQGKAVTDTEEAALFSFDWKNEDRNYGTVVVLLGDESDLEVYYGDNLGRGMEAQDKDAWYDFLHDLKRFASENMLSFQPQDINRLKYTMQGMAAIKEGLFEGYYGTKKVSYSDQPKRTKLVIKHNRTLGEGDARFRYIESLFIENDQGERFKLPFTKLLGGRAMARHCAEGGNPYDAFGQHISQIVAEMNTLSKFVRAAKNRQFGEQATGLVESAIRHYQALKTKAKAMVGQRGYREARQAFDPAQFTDSEVAVEAIRDMFLEQTLDSRIEEALPILAKLAEEQNTMVEADVFEQWADSVTEGTWALPDTPEAKKKLQNLMSQELPVGPDATNATEQLYDIIGDDELFDQLDDLSNIDPDADARPVIQARMSDLGITMPEVDATPEPQTQPDLQQTPEPTAENLVGAPIGGAEPVRIRTKADEDLDTDGVMMNKPSNMSSESRDRSDLYRLVELAKG